MTRTYTPRRGAQQWQSLVEQWQHSGQPATQFCREREVGYASFCQWRKRLLSDDAVIAQSASISDADQPAFIDLASLGTPASGWHIVLRLGQGVELTLSRR